MKTALQNHIIRFPVDEITAKDALMEDGTYSTLDPHTRMRTLLGHVQLDIMIIDEAIKLQQVIKKGFVLDEERLKQGNAVFGKDYFRELLEKVRSIRASERRIWQQITDIYAECSFDYDRNSPTTREFYQMVQNRFHYAITGQTAPEIIYTRADHTKDHMGLQTWKNAPDGRVLISDTKVAKNYLPEVEIRRLERAVSGYFDYIEDLIERENAFSMEQFSASVNEFLTFRRYALLPDKGKTSREQADRKAEEEYKLFNPTQQIDSDFDKEVRGLLEGRE